MRPRTRAHPYARDAAANTTSSSRSRAGSSQQPSSPPARPSVIQANLRNLHQVGGALTRENPPDAADDGQNFQLSVNIIAMPIAAVIAEAPVTVALPPTSSLEGEQGSEIDDLPDETDSEIDGSDDEEPGRRYCDGCSEYHTDSDSEIGTSDEDDDETPCCDHCFARMYCDDCLDAMSSGDEGPDDEFFSQETHSQPVNQALADAPLTAYDCSQPSDSQRSYNHNCKVCDVHEIRSACMPCGHFCVCQICYDRLVRIECPMCRASVTDFKPIFF